MALCAYDMKPCPHGGVGNCEFWIGDDKEVLILCERNKSLRFKDKLYEIDGKTRIKR